MTITQYEDKYKDQTINLILSIQQDEFNIDTKEEDRPDLQDIPSTYLDHPHSNFWLALYNDNVIGTISIASITKHKLALQNMYVHKDFRGMKYDTASKLLKETINFAKEKDIKKIFLGTAADFFAAHKFYERNGFAQINKESLPKEFPIMSVDSKFYELIL